ncbi:MAG: RdgB/HAM1 family non-canonical purine NTP pyrophosphatase [Bryobacteraceae bacterium]
MKLYCATINHGKLAEFRLAAETFAERRIDLEPVPRIHEISPFPETGAGFEENATGKALYYGRFCEGWLFADDSGLEVDHLGGAPGVLSARYAGEGASDEANNRLLLERMRGLEHRDARFVCVAALVRGGEIEGVFRGTVEGRLLEEPRGTNGFGYDPLFYFPPAGCTLAEMDGPAKLAISHRGQALRSLFARFVVIAR